jgi:hypothetical protein
MIEFGLSYICDYSSETQSYSPNADKIKKSVALAMFYVKEDYRLSEYI